jgi:hypothetical protein
MPRKATITEHPTDSTGIERARKLCASIPFMPHGWRLLTAFQGLALPKGCQTRRGNTRTVCAQCIVEVTGLPCTRAWKPDVALTKPAKGEEDPDGALVHYVAALFRHNDSKGRVFDVEAETEARTG